MKKNNSSLTISQALKVYSGSGLPKMILKFTCIMTIIYIGSIVFLTLLIGLQSGFETAHKEISETPFISIFLAMYGGIDVVIISVMTYEKKIPGGKFIRSVKGGFETYKKVRTALTLTTIIAICVSMGVICALNTVMPIFKNGTATCVSVTVFLMLGIGTANFVNMIENELARSFLNIIILIALSTAGVLTVYLSNGRLGTVHIIAAILAALLIPVSHKMMLASYRKNRWDK